MRHPRASIQPRYGVADPVSYVQPYGRFDAARVNSDVSERLGALTNVLTLVTGGSITIVLALVAMFSLSWQLTLIAISVLPCCLIGAAILEAPDGPTWLHNLQSDFRLDDNAYRGGDYIGGLVGKTLWTP